MTISIDLKGSKEMQAAFRRASAEVKEEAGRVVTATAINLRADVVNRIQRGPASGRVYQKYNPRRTHQASAPGQAPMSDTGRLANSITFDQIGSVTATVGSRLAYAVYLEYGTSRMNNAGGVGGPRPFFRPAVEDARDDFRQRLEAALRGAVR